MMSQIRNNKAVLFFCWIFIYSVVISVSVAAKDVAKENVEKKLSLKDFPEYNDEGKSDPFVPLVTKEGILTHISNEKKDANFYLQGIFYDDKGESMALINEQVVRKNDMIGECKIVDIKKESVVYTKNGELFMLNLFGEEGGLDVKK